jgi:hypothetical protein
MEGICVSTFSLDQSAIGHSKFMIPVFWRHQHHSIDKKNNMACVGVQIYVFYLFPNVECLNKI